MPLSLTWTAGVNAWLSWREDPKPVEKLADSYRSMPDSANPSLSLTAQRARRDVAERELFAKLSAAKRPIARQVLKEIRSRLGFLVDVGLDYLTLDRASGTLSGGEAQRIRLATQIGSSLMGVLYILDEPSIGLHQRDNDRLIATLVRLRDLGNTLLVVEHDEETIRAADWSSTSVRRQASTVDG